jgi:hypothetical protein
MHTLQPITNGLTANRHRNVTVFLRHLWWSFIAMLASAIVIFVLLMACYVHIIRGF